MLHVWNIYLHLAQKLPSFVGTYSIHGASGIYKVGLQPPLYNCIGYIHQLLVIKHGVLEHSQ